jgi:hypothetical protein
MYRPRQLFFRGLAGRRLDLEKAKIKFRKLLDPKRQEVVDFVREFGLKVVPIGANKNPIPNNWTNPEVYEPYQEAWLNQFLTGDVWALGLICGIKAKNGLYFVVWDADSKEAYELVKQFENQTTVVKSGGEKLKKSEVLGKDISRHFYFFSPTLPRTKRHEKGEPAYDFQSKGVHVCAPCTRHPDTGREYEFLSRDSQKRPLAPMVWDGDIELDFKRMREEAFGIKESTEPEKVDIVTLLSGVERGLRDDAGIKIASWCRTQGKTEDEAYEILKVANAKNKPPMGTDKDDPNEDTWIRAKIKSAWRGSEPYHYKFIEREMFTEEQIEKAKWLLDHPEEAIHFFHEANEDVVREHKLKVIALILAFAKQSEEVSGRSGSGKSEVIKRILECFPKQWWEMVTGLTDKALRWLDDYLRILFIAERKGMQTGEESTAEYDIKVGISEKEIKIIYPEKGPDGKLHKAEKRSVIDCFILTTTDAATTEELGNRLNELVTDESPEQNLAVLDYIADEYTKFPDERLKEICAKKKAILRCYFEMLDKEAPQEVLIPYLPIIIKKFFHPFPNDPAVRRHGYKLVNYIYAVSQIFYKKLIIVERNGKRVAIASPEVFWYVWQLADVTIFSELIMMNPRQMEVWKKIDNLLSQVEFATEAQVGKAIDYSSMQTKRYLEFFAKKNLVEITYQGRNLEIRRLGKLKETTNISNVGSFTLADLHLEYKKWLEKNTFTPSQGGEDKKIELKNFITGEPLRRCEGLTFQLSNLFQTKIVVSLSPSQKMKVGKQNQEKKRLEDFENALKS